MNSSGKLVAGRVHLGLRRSVAVVCGFLLALAVSPFVSSAFASTTYFASPSGSDAITCAANSQANPFATIQAALACTTDGDAVSLAPDGGTPYPGIGTVDHNVTIEAESGANARTVEADVSGSGPMTVPDGTSVTVEGVSITCVDGLADDPCGSNITNHGTLTLQGDSVRGSTNAAAIKNYSPDGGSADLTVLDSTISDNPNFGAGTLAAGIESTLAPGTTTAQAPTLTIANSTIADNGTNGNAPRGGGIDVTIGTATIVNSTISGNHAQMGGGIASQTFNGVELSNTVVAGNTSSTGGPDCQTIGTASGITDGSGGHNLIGDGTSCGTGLTDGTNGDQVGVASPGLNALADNGGPTDTVGLQTSSPAIAAGDLSTCNTAPISGLDQRGEARDGATCEIGAFDTPPIAVDDSYAIREDAAPQRFRVRVNDLAGPQQVTSTTDPAHGSVAITNAGKDLTYTPDPNYCNYHQANPLDTFTYTVNGGSTATVSVLVRCVDDLPTAVDDSYTIRQGSGPQVFHVRDNDLDVDGGLMQVIAATNSGHANVAVANAGRNVTYTPDPGYCNPHGTLPDDTFTYTLNGGSTATVSVRVRCGSG